jgi:hypothetical protein
MTSETLTRIAGVILLLAAFAIWPRRWRMFLLSISLGGVVSAAQWLSGSWWVTMALGLAWAFATDGIARRKGWDRP